MIEVDPFDSLALSLHHNPGVYSLLVGSGLSRAAGVPTGWEITLSLISKLAATQGVTAHEDWAQWYQLRYSKRPSYSEILDAIATTPAERRSILHGYIESSGEDKTRKPTKAHRGIAQLVARGIVRVVVTTNFDRLIEGALRELAIEPTVISNDDALAGAVPLIHSGCTLIKLHGDFLDSRIKNTEDELSSYSPGITSLLDEVLDRFGVVVVGWSGEWDTALRSAFLRAPSRRYPMYWASRGGVSPLAEDIVAHRGARLIPIRDADSFFGRLSDTLDALHKASRAHPQSIHLTIALAKKFSRHEEQGLEWFELLSAEVEKIRDFVTGPNYPSAHPTKESFNALIAELVGRSEALRRICMICARWGTLGAKQSLLKVIRSLVLSGTAHSGFGSWISLRDFVASLCFYWSVAGALYGEDYETVRALMHIRTQKDGADSYPAISHLALASLDSVEWKLLDGLDQRRTPASDFVVSLFSNEIQDIAMDRGEAEDIFDRVEFLMSLEFSYFRLSEVKSSGIWFWMPPGRYIWRRHGKVRSTLLAAFSDNLDRHPAVLAGLLGGERSTAEEVMAAIREHLGKISAW